MTSKIFDNIFNQFFGVPMEHRVKIFDGMTDIDFALFMEGVRNKTTGKMFPRFHTFHSDDYDDIFKEFMEGNFKW